jgi:glucan biosynthesis protein
MIDTNFTLSREESQEIGIAPLTVCFHGEDVNIRPADDFRPVVMAQWSHDPPAQASRYGGR